MLITGAGGQVGSELAARANDRALSVDRAHLDISDRAAVWQLIQTHNPSIVINAAAYTSVDRAEQDSERAFAVNRDGAGHLASACRSLGIPLLHLSTDYVFDGNKAAPYLESDPASPLGVYARSKWEGEQRIRLSHHQHLILRVSWVFGTKGNNFVKTILRLAEERTELRIVVDQRGCPTEASTIAEALLSIAQRYLDGESIPWGTYHYTGTPETTWYGFANQIVDEAAVLGLIGKKPSITPITTSEYPLPAPRPANSLLDCSHAESALGLIRRDWRQGLSHVLEKLRHSSS